MHTDKLPEVLEIAIEAGALALRYREGVASTLKPDGSPVTAADVACDDLIRTALAQLGRIPIISEETEPGPNDSNEIFWLVDPLDGTKEYMRGSAEFTVNIALIVSGTPILGVVHAPALGITYFAAKNTGAFRRKGSVDTRIHVSTPAGVLRVALSRDHVGAAERHFLSQFPSAEVVPMGSSLKFCLVAEGSADLYPRLGPTREWDTAAAQCVVEEAGGHVVERNHTPLRYGKPGLLNPSLLTYGAEFALVNS